MASLSLTRDAQAVTDDLSRLAIRDAVDLWRSGPIGDVDEFLQLLLVETPRLTRMYGEIAADISADSYMDQRADARVRGRFEPDVVTSAPVGQVEAAVRWSVGPIEVDRAVALAQFAGSVDRLIRMPGRQTILRSAASDPAATGVVRVAAPDACGFCLLLASRGQMHVDLHGDATADRWHRNCRCAPAPTFGAGRDDMPAPDVLYAEYLAVTDGIHDHHERRRAWNRHIAALQR